MTKYKSILQSLAFLEAVKSGTTIRYILPTLNLGQFEVEWRGARLGWRYRSFGASDWIDSSLAGLVTNLDRNDVDLAAFKEQVDETIFTSITYAYDLVTEACKLFGDDTVYEKIEETYSNLELELEDILTDKTLHYSPILRLIKK